MEIATFLEDLKSYLVNNGIENIYRDFMPDEPAEAIGLFLWSHSVPSINDGSGTRYIQVQVRSNDGDTAYKTACEIVPLLDSGEDEKVIFLTESRWCIARPRTLPCKMRESVDGTVVYYCEFALFGANIP